MKTTLITALTGLLTLSTAASTTPKLFALKTETSDTRFNNLCVTSYHTGAGTGDATLTPCTASSKVFYLNSTAIGSTIYGTATPSGFQAALGTSYDSWYPATINVGYGYEGFKYSAADGFLANGEYGFLGCYWAHYGTQQLFVLSGAANETKVIETCALVKLVKG